MSDGLLRTAAEFREGYRESLGSIGAMAATLDETRALLPTGCPGWSVRDIVAHVSDLEGIMLGDARAGHELSGSPPHVRSDVGRFMELGVDMRRSWPLQRLLDEFRTVSARRDRDLDAVDEEALERDAQGIFGMSRLRSILTIRIFDLWSHEQDLRRALGTPGGFEGPAARHSREMLARGVGRRAAERLHPAAGTSVLLDITGKGAARRTISFDDGKSLVSPASEGHADVTLRLDFPTLTVLGCGRADDPGARARVVVEGDEALGRSIIDDIASTP